MNAQRLSCKTALITGAASGIGAVHARLFALHCAKVLMCDIQEEPGLAIAAGICKAGGSADFKIGL